MKNPLVSIIIPVYNSKAYLTNCLDSIVSQTYSPCEIVLVDDCSTDGSEHIIEQYKEKYSNILTVHHNKNKGIGGARNTGLKISQGEYIVYVDSDDEVTEDFCKELVNIIGTADIAVAGRSTFVNEKYTKSKTAPEIEVVDHVTAIQYQLRGIYSSHPAWGKLYKREIAYCVPFDEKYVFEDIRYSLETYIHSDKVVFSNKDMYKYKMHPNTVMTSNANRQIEGHTYAALFVYNRLKEEGLFSQCDSAFRVFLARAIIRNTREFNRNHIELDVFKKFSPILVDMIEELGGL